MSGIVTSGFIIKYNFRILLVKNLQLKSIITRTHTNLSVSAVCLLSGVFSALCCPPCQEYKDLCAEFSSKKVYQGCPPPSAVSSRRNVCRPGKLASASRHLTMMNAVPRDAAYKILPNAKNYKKHRLLEESGKPAPAVI